MFIEMEADFPTLGVLLQSKNIKTVLSQVSIFYDADHYIYMLGSYSNFGILDHNSGLITIEIRKLLN